jgi:ribonuclease P protein subunit RPR2
MAKEKGAKGAGSVPNKALYSRVSFLYQAATYLATQQQHSTLNIDGEINIGASGKQPVESAASANSTQASFQRSSRRLVSHLRAVSLKAQLRMSPAMKRSICKNCDSILSHGSTCLNEIENKSKGGKKQLADVLVRTCNTCGLAKRFPMAERQNRRPNRILQDKACVEAI